LEKVKWLLSRFKLKIQNLKIKNQKNVVKTIFQKVVFKNTSVKTLYNIYMDGRMHSEPIGTTNRTKYC
jgi:hypothetical protein